MRFQVHNQLAGFAICATRLFHSACQSILQSILQNSGHREQMSNTQTSSISQSMSSWILRYFLLRQLLCSLKKRLCKSIWGITVIQKFSLCCSSFITTIDCSCCCCCCLKLWGQSAQYADTMTLIFLPSVSLLLKMFSCLQPARVLTLPWHKNTHTHKYMILAI